MASDEVRISSSLFATVTEDHDNINNRNSNDGEGIELTAVVTNQQPQEQQQDRSKSAPISLTELNYGISSYHVIVPPVTLTMIFSALVVTHIQSPAIDTKSSINSFYNAFQISDEYSAGTNLGLSMANAFIIVCCVAAATFGIVLLYKFRCMKCLFGYMVLSSASLLGLLGSVIVSVAIQKYEITIDIITFYFLLFNFAIVGTISIFFARGIPTFVTQGYLVMTSVILAWQLSQFNDWTAWCLLVALALYDLCAVLTPCGPLKALIGLMSKDGAPSLPGLLYEAKLPTGVERPSATTGSSSNNNSNDNVGANGNNNTNNDYNDDKKRKKNNTQKSNGKSNNNRGNDYAGGNNRQQSTVPSNIQNISHDNSEQQQLVTGNVPLAIALIYKLPIQSPSHYSGGASRDRSQYNASELTSDVVVLFRRNGGYIQCKDPEITSSSSKWSLFRKRQSRSHEKPKYIVYDRYRNIKRTLIVDENGRVFEEVQGDDSEDGALASNSIKLGLGDFIFYSLLVSKAAQYSFTTFSACMLVILAGLGGTLVLLSVYHTALPALPISIFLGVVFYFLTRALIEPHLIEAVLIYPVYV